ncbi:MAG: complex I subunit 5 family protein [Symbiobacteriaceae bacterium]|nr:complex I subunit 5 family protein [Symbiobacteriaceae bacterium]
MEFVLGSWQLSFSLNGFSSLYGVLTCCAWLVSTLFAREYLAKSTHRTRYTLSSLATLVTVLGVFGADNLATTFLFFELMAFTSYALVAHEESPEALRGAQTYLAIAIAGGMSILIGMMLLYQRFATLNYNLLYEYSQALADKGELYLPAALLLLGFGAKAGLWPLHIWLPKAHPVAPAPASALLSGVLTKTGIVGVIVASTTLLASDIPWSVALMAVASITMLWGAVAALFSRDMKRTLACSSVSQIGFITSGIASLALLGYHDGIAARGVLLHMVNHTLIKLVLFTLAGVVYLQTHDLSYRSIRGFAKGKPLFTLLFLLAAGALAGIPLFSGYISKTLLHEALVEGIYYAPSGALAAFLQIVEIIFLSSGGITFAYMALLGETLLTGNASSKGKMPRTTPRTRRSPGQRRPPPAVEGVREALSPGYRVLWLLLAVALLFPLLGIFPILAERVVDPAFTFLRSHEVDHPIPYYAWINLRGALISLTIGGGIFLVMRHERAAGTLGAKLYELFQQGSYDLEDKGYRPLLQGILGHLIAAMQRLASLPELLVKKIRVALLTATRNPYQPGSFLEGHYYLFSSTAAEANRRPVTISYPSTTLSLLLAAAGLFIILSFLFSQAL